MTPRLVLASASPRRLELLRLAGLDPVVRPADVDESPLPGETPFETAARLAEVKAVAARGAGEVALGGDTIVVVDGEALGKPADDDVARAMLRRLSGRTHVVVGGVAVASDRLARGGIVTTEVTFADLGDAQIDWYVSTGEGRDKAGAYGLQGAGAALVLGIRGDHTNVVGLPLRTTLELLGEEGIGPFRS